MEKGKYINDERITDEFLEEILNKCGFELIRYQSDGKSFLARETEPIIRFDHQIMCHCRNVAMLEFIRDLKSTHPLFRMTEGLGFSVGDEVVFFEDFMANRLTYSEEIHRQDEKLFEEFYRAMASLFGKEYEDDFEIYRTEFLKSVEEESLQTGDEKGSSDNTIYIKEVENQS